VIGPILIGLLVLLPYALVGVGMYLLSGLPIALITVGLLILLTALVVGTVRD
jgi:hypothetical protein